MFTDELARDLKRYWMADIQASYKQSISTASSGGAGGGGVVVDTTWLAWTAAHLAAADPHPQYLTLAEGNALYVPLGRLLTGGVGINTIGDLSANRTISVNYGAGLDNYAGAIGIGLPSALSATTVNSASGTTHAHAITTTTVGAISTIVATNGSGDIQAGRYLIAANGYVKSSGAAAGFQFDDQTTPGSYLWNLRSIGAIVRLNLNGTDLLTLNSAGDFSVGGNIDNTGYIHSRGAASEVGWEDRVTGISHRFWWQTVSGVASLVAATGGTILTANETGDVEAKAYLYANGRIHAKGGASELSTDDRTLGSGSRWAIYASANTLRLYKPGVGDLFYFGSGTTNAYMWTDAGGRVGIGISPAYPLHIQSTTQPQIRIAYTPGTHKVDLGISSAGDTTWDQTGPRLMFVPPVRLQSNNYVSQTTGWAAGGQYGSADFRYIFTDELHARKFVADTEFAFAGLQIVAKSFGILSQPFTAPAPGGGTTAWFWDMKGSADAAVFENGDFILIRQWDRTGGGLAITNCWGIVTGYTDGTGSEAGQQQYAFTRSAAPNAGAMTTGAVIAIDNTAVDFGSSIAVGGVVSGGYYEVNAIDGIYGEYSPYAQTVRWTVHPATGKVVTSRYGNLKGIFGQPNEYGIYAGTGTTTADRWIRASSYAMELHNMPLNIFDGANLAMTMVPATPYFSLGSIAPTDYMAGDGVWMGKHSSFYKLRIGTIAGGKLYRGLSWDGSNLKIVGSAIIGNGAGFAVAPILYATYFAPPRPSGSSATVIPVNMNGHLGQKATIIGGAKGAAGGRFGTGALDLATSGSALVYSVNDNILAGQGSIFARIFLGAYPAPGETPFICHAGGVWPRGISLYVDDAGRLRFLMGNSAGTFTEITSSITVLLNQWMDIGCSWLAGSAMALYINGVLVASGSTGVTADLPNTATISVGYAPTLAGNNFWRGYLNEFAIIPRNLTTDEFEQITASNAPLVVTRTSYDLYLGEAGSGNVTANVTGLYGVSSGGFPNFSLLNSAQTVNGEALGAGSVLLGDNSASRGNMLWNNTSGLLLMRVGTSNRVAVDTAGNVAVGEIGANKSYVYTTAGAISLIYRNAASVDQAQVNLDVNGFVTVGPIANSKSRVLTANGDIKLIYRDGAGVDSERIVLTTAGVVTVGEVANSKSRTEITSGNINMIYRSAAGVDTTHINLDVNGFVTVGPIANSKSRVLTANGDIKLIYRNGAGVDSERIVLTTAGVVTVGEVANSKSRTEITSGNINMIYRSAAAVDTTQIQLDVNGFVTVGPVANSKSRVLTANGDVYFVTRDAGGVDRERITLTAAGTMSFKNNVGTDMITLDSSGSSYFAGVMGIGLSGMIQQGTGTFGSTFQGMAIRNISGLGRIEFYESSSGAFTTVMDADGLRIRAGVTTNARNSIRWLDAVGNNIGEISGYTSGGYNQTFLGANPVGAAPGKVTVYANGPTASNFAYTVWDAGNNVVDTFVPGSGRWRVGSDYNESYFATLRVVRSYGSALFALDASQTGYSLTIANNGTATPFGASNNFSGEIRIYDTTVDGVSTHANCGGGGVALFGTIGGIFTTTVGTASRINIYYSANVLTIQNLSGISRIFNVVAFRGRGTN